MADMNRFCEAEEAERVTEREKVVNMVKAIAQTRGKFNDECKFMGLAASLEGQDLFPYAVERQ